MVLHSQKKPLSAPMMMKLFWRTHDAIIMSLLCQNTAKRCEVVLINDDVIITPCVRCNDPHIGYRFTSWHIQIVEPFYNTIFFLQNSYCWQKSFMSSYIYVYPTHCQATSNAASCRVTSNAAPYRVIRRYHCILYSSRRTVKPLIYMAIYWAIKLLVTRM